MAVPTEVMDAARFAFTAHLPGAALLQAVTDDAGRPEDSGRRRVRYADSRLSVEVEVEHRPDGLAHLKIRLVPTVEAEVQLQRAGADLGLVARGVPPFTLAAAPGGLTRLVIRVDEGVSLRGRWQTAWTRL